MTAAHGDKQALFSADPATGRMADKPLLASPDFDLQPLLLVGQGKLLGVRHLLDAEVTHWPSEGSAVCAA